MYLHCEKCHNVVGQTFTTAAGLERTRISIKVRGQSRRVMIVQSLETVSCDRCGHDGPPLPELTDRPAARSKITGSGAELPRAA